MVESNRDVDVNRTPRWVKVFGVIAIIIAVAFLILHLAGGGLGRHMAP
jgi:hypothetical protein